MPAARGNWLVYLYLQPLDQLVGRTIPPDADINESLQCEWQSQGLEYVRFYTHVWLQQPERMPYKYLSILSGSQSEERGRYIEIQCLPEKCLLLPSKKLDSLLQHITHWIVPVLPYSFSEKTANENPVCVLQEFWKEKTGDYVSIEILNGDTEHFENKTCSREILSSVGTAHHTVILYRKKLVKRITSDRVVFAPWLAGVPPVPLESVWLWWSQKLNFCNGSSRWETGKEHPGWSMKFWTIISRSAASLKFLWAVVPLMRLHESLATTCRKKWFPSILIVCVSQCWNDTNN